MFQKPNVHCNSDHFQAQVSSLCGFGRVVLQRRRFAKLELSKKNIGGSNSFVAREIVTSTEQT